MLALALLFACNDEKDTNTADSAEEATPEIAETPLGISHFGFACAGPGWGFELVTEGWAERAELEIYTGSPDGPTLAESHPFPAAPLGYDPLGAWERRGLDLDYGSFSAGESTAWACADPPGVGVALRVRVFDAANQVADCRTQGNLAADPGC